MSCWSHLATTAPYVFVFLWVLRFYFFCAESDTKTFPQRERLSSLPSNHPSVFAAKQTQPTPLNSNQRSFSLYLYLYSDFSMQSSHKVHIASCLLACYTQRTVCTLCLECREKLNLRKWNHYNQFQITKKGVAEFPCYTLLKHMLRH